MAAATAAGLVNPPLAANVALRIRPQQTRTPQDTFSLSRFASRSNLSHPLEHLASADPCLEEQDARDGTLMPEHAGLSN